MTQAELDALPTDGEFGQRTEERDGKRVIIPFLQTVGVLYHDPADPIMVTDRQGIRWLLGRHNGVLHKRRMAHQW